MSNCVRSMKAVVKRMFIGLYALKKNKQGFKSVTCVQLNTLKQEEEIKYMRSINKKTIKISTDASENENTNTIKKNDKSKNCFF